MEARALSLPARRTQRWLGHAASIAFFAALALLVAVAVATLLGFRVLVDRSDSMQPAIAAGDLIVTKRVHPAAVGVGDIITFSGSERGGELVTHRVTEKRNEQDWVTFVTRGDANSGVERWSIHEEGTLGKFALRIPKAGYAATWLATPAARLAAVALLALLLGGFALRRIWRS